MPQKVHGLQPGTAPLALAGFRRKYKAYGRKFPLEEAELKTDQRKAIPINTFEIRENKNRQTDRNPGLMVYQFNHLTFPHLQNENHANSYFLRFEVNLLLFEL